MLLVQNKSKRNTTASTCSEQKQEEYNSINLLKQKQEEHNNIELLGTKQVDGVSRALSRTSCLLVWSQHEK